MDRQTTIIFLGDGMADEPMAELDGKTPLQVARTPAMDTIAREGRCGTLRTLPEGFPTSSDVANMSVLGCDLESEYAGRGALEAAARGIELPPGALAFRLNLVRVDENGCLRDFSGGHPSQADSEAIIDLLQRELGGQGVRFVRGVSYRNLLILSFPELSARVATEKPDDNQGNALEAHLPRALVPEAEPTAVLLRRIIREASTVLAASGPSARAREKVRPGPNAIWPWSGGRIDGFRSLRERYGIRGAVVSAVDVIKGLGRCLGMDVIPVAGATGYIDTNYEGKADAAIQAAGEYDLVYLHVEAMDEVSHNQDLSLKIRAIEDFDRRVIARVARALGEQARTVVLPDHPVPLALGRHTRTPVPVAIRDLSLPPDPVETFDEIACCRGALGAMRGSDLMKRLFPVQG